MMKRRFFMLCIVLFSLISITALSLGHTPPINAQGPPTPSARRLLQEQPGRSGLRISATDSLEKVGHIGGVLTAMAWRDPYVLLGEGTSLTILDASSPAKLVKAGRYINLPGIVWDIQLVGTYGYIADGIGGLQIIDITNPVIPVKVGIFDAGYDIRSVQIVGNLAFLSDAGGYGPPSYTYEDGGLRVVDVSDPTKPVEISRYQTSYMANQVYIEGNLAYLAAGSAGLHLINIEDPANPTRISAYDTGGNTYHAQVQEKIAYVTDFNAGLVLIDVSDPLNPKELSVYESPGDAYQVYVQESRAYVLDWQGYENGETIPGGLRVVDISDPKNPQELASFDTGDTFDIAFISGLTYLVTIFNGLIITDLNNLDGELPLIDKYFVFQGGIFSFDVDGNRAYLVDWLGGLQIADLSDMTNPVKLGPNNQLDNSHLDYQTTLFANNSLLYVANQTDELRIIDVHNPLTITEVGTVPGQAKDIYVRDGLAYIAAQGNGLKIVDVTDPANPNELSRTSTGVSEVDVNGDFAYIIRGLNDIQVIDIQDPHNPIPFEPYVRNNPYSLTNLKYNQGVVYVGDYRGLKLFDVRNPGNIIEHISNEVSLTALGITSNGNLAYVAAAGQGLQVIDVSDPLSQSVNASYQTFGYASDVKIKDDLIFLSDDLGGFTILRDSRTYSLTGQITDEAGDPLPNIPIHNSAGAPLISDADGRYRLSDLPLGAYTLTPTKPGYRFDPPTRKVKVPIGSTPTDFTASRHPEVVINSTPLNLINVDQRFTASLHPNEVSFILPVTYTWQATDQSTTVHSGLGISDTIVYNWGTPGPQTITVTVTRPSGLFTGSLVIPTQLTATYTITTGLPSYFPLIFR